MDISPNASTDTTDPNKNVFDGTRLLVNAEMEWQSPHSAFVAHRINSTTFVITEHDRFSERPLMYAKLYSEASILLLCDTGCNAPHKSVEGAPFTRLRDFLEHCPVNDNGGQPLNRNGSMRYVNIITHCHYDHIGAIAQFSSSYGLDSPPNIVASAYGQTFVETDLYEHSLCKSIGLPEIDYRPTVWAGERDRLFFKKGRVFAVSDELADRPMPLDNYDLQVTVLNTPGHTPDSLAWYDHQERHLFVGDSFYRFHSAGYPLPWLYAGTILFPKESNLSDYLQSMQSLLGFVRIKNLEGDIFGQQRVRIGCAHATFNEDAEILIGEVISFFHRILAHKLPVVLREIIRGEEHVGFYDNPRGRELAVTLPLWQLWETESLHKSTSS